MMARDRNMKTTLISLAMLKVQLDEKNQTYIDYFVPYLLHVIKQQFDTDNENTELDFSEIQSNVKDVYGLEIPLNAIKLIIHRIVKKHPTILRKRNHKYFIISVKSVPDRDKKFANVERGITAVCNALVEFSKDKPLQFQNIEESFEAILEFLSEFPIETLTNIQKNSALPQTCHRNNKRIVLTALFIQHLSNNDTENYNNFSNIVKGYMLTNVLLCLDTAEQDMRIHTCFYIDTPLILSCFGFDGEANKKSIKELFTLILNLGGELCVFSHTVEEIQRVIDAFVRGKAHHNMRTQRLATSEIVVIQENLDGKIKAEKIKIEQTPTATKHKKLHGYQIDEIGLENRLKKEIIYAGNKAHEYDTKSISAIHLLRRGDVNYKLEQVPSLITDNAKLISTVAKFERENNIGGRCSAVTSFMVTNLLWLKNPMALPDLPMKTIIAQSYGLLDNPDLWEKFLQKVEQLHQSGSITKEEIQYLRGSERVIQEIISKATLGDPGNLEGEVVSVIVEEAKNKIIQEEINKVSRAEERVNDSKERENKMLVFTSHILTVISYVLLGLILFILQYFFQATIITGIFVTILSIAGICTYKKAHEFYKNKISNCLGHVK